MEPYTPVIVTTKHRGVFFGLLGTDQEKESRTLTLRECRNAMYWSGKRGFLGLAASGPESESRIGATAPSVMLHDVTSVSVCTPEAEKVWREWN